MRKTDIEIANEDMKEFQDDLFAAHKEIDKLKVENERLEEIIEKAVKLIGQAPQYDRDIYERMTFDALELLCNVKG